MNRFTLCSVKRLVSLYFKSLNTHILGTSITPAVSCLQQEEFPLLVVQDYGESLQEIRGNEKSNIKTQESISSDDTSYGSLEHAAKFGKSLQRQMHPDIGPLEETFEEDSNVFEVISN